MNAGHGDLEEDSVSELVLQSIRHRLRDAFQNPAAGQGHPGGSSGAREGKGRPHGAHREASEELRRAKIEGALSWIRTELLEMRQQDCQLAKSLLHLGKEIHSMRAWREPSSPAAAALFPPCTPTEATRSPSAVHRAQAVSSCAPATTPDSMATAFHSPSAVLDVTPSPAFHCSR
ncbi:uncharacterized protein LOC144935725 [Lampetra fluviatilis]